MCYCIMNFLDKGLLSNNANITIASSILQEVSYDCAFYGPFSDKGPGLEMMYLSQDF